ncbi:ABC transporter ATP-binding protein [Engelhardtia mirabilis]|uniref:ABC transporter ATP-binding protein n=1 Tax=Engelhardtia mirabilis TaxID=2528011 RepID=UPI00118C04A9|nr:putative ABC transporter ATP-binding protein YxlF [Planctomycetes bacterium Pla86]
MITIRDLTKRFGRVCALSEVSFDVEAGEAVALWGGNGAGKTTLLRCLLGALRHGGSVEVDGLDARRQGKAVRARIGYVPQELAFHDDMRVGAALAFFARLRVESLGRAAEILARAGLAGHERKRVRDLSGGMKQRLALAVATLGDPPVVVMDEPTSNLDAAGRAQVVESLRELRRSGKTVLFSSHRPEEVRALADRVLVLDGGRLVRTATPDELWPSGDGGPRSTLHIPDSDRERALEVLAAAGIEVLDGVRDELAPGADQLARSGVCEAVRGDAQGAIQ